VLEPLSDEVENDCRKLVVQPLCDVLQVVVVVQEGASNLVVQPLAMPASAPLKSPSLTSTVCDAGAVQPMLPLAVYVTR